MDDDEDGFRGCCSECADLPLHRDAGNADRSAGSHRRDVQFCKCNVHVVCFCYSYVHVDWIGYVHGDEFQHIDVHEHFVRDDHHVGNQDWIRVGNGECHQDRNRNVNADQHQHWHWEFDEHFYNVGKLDGDSYRYGVTA